jgi:predicted esterase YcpF (UPF0227 family)
MKFLFLHGLGSGANSGMAAKLAKAFPDAEIVHPELPIRPKEAMEFLMKNYWDWFSDFDLIIGTSLGGFYALAMPFMWVKKVVINPAMFADEDILKGIGLGPQKVRCEREDGVKEFVIDQSFIDELKEIREKTDQGWDIWHPEKAEVNQCNSTFALFGEKDELVRHYDDFTKRYIADQAEMFPGGHYLTEEEVRDYAAPFIRKVLEAPSPPAAFVFDD